MKELRKLHLESKKLTTMIAYMKFPLLTIQIGINGFLSIGREIEYKFNFQNTLDFD